MDKQQSIIVQGWVDILILRWQRQLKRRGVGVTEELFNSFTSSIATFSPEVVKSVDLTFLYYGRLRDMGVGRGTSLADLKNNSRPLKRARSERKRKPAKWYSPTLAAEVKELGEILARDFANKGINIIEKEFQRTININLNG